MYIIRVIYFYFGLHLRLILILLFMESIQLNLHLLTPLRTQRRQKALIVINSASVPASKLMIYKMPARFIKYSYRTIDNYNDYNNKATIRHNAKAAYYQVKNLCLQQFAALQL